MESDDEGVVVLKRRASSGDSDDEQEQEAAQDATPAVDVGDDKPRLSRLKRRGDAPAEGAEAEAFATAPVDAPEVRLPCLSASWPPGLRRLTAPRCAASGRARRRRRCGRGSRQRRGGRRGRRGGGGAGRGGGRGGTARAPRGRTRHAQRRRGGRGRRGGGGGGREACVHAPRDATARAELVRAGSALVRTRRGERLACCPTHDCFARFLP